jgi:hypothetical protein
MLNTWVWHIGLDNKVFEELTRKLRVSDVSKYIQSLKEMYVDFYSMYLV